MIQPRHGFRVAIDTVLLAAATPATSGDNVYDFGCGVGGALLCLAARVARLRITGVEIQSELAELARKNCVFNNFNSETTVEDGDVTALMKPALLAKHVMINPPYHDERRHEVSEHVDRRLANTEKADDLRLWLESAFRILDSEGLVTLIHRFDRLESILGAIGAMPSLVKSMPILPKKSAVAKRVLVQISRAGAARRLPCKPLILHDDGGAFTTAAEAHLRHAEPILFEPE